MAETLLAWIATYLVHSSVLLGGAWAFDVAHPMCSAAAREFVWRIAFFGAFVSTAVAHMPERVAPKRPSPDGVTLVVPAAIPAKLAPTFDPSVRDEAREARAPVVLPARSPERAVFALPSMSARWQSALSLVLAAIGLIGLARLLLAARRERACARALAVCNDARMVHDARELAAALGAPAPTLRFTDAGESPYATGVAQLCLPRWSLALEAGERRGLLAHELAHLARRDPAWRIAVAAVLRVAWMQPLNALAARRLDSLAELDCDARAAAALGDGRGLARCLAACAQQLLAPAPALAAAMTRRRSALVERIERLIEDQRMSHPSWNVAVRIGAASALVVALGVLPAVRFVAIAAERTHHVSITSTNGDESFSMENSHLGLDVKIDGKVEFTAAEDDIASLADEAKIEQETDGVLRRIEFRNRGGKVEKRYFVDDDEQPLDAAGRAWLAQVIPVLLREGGFDAEGRVARIFARGGAGAVLDEVEHIRGDYARRAYLVALAETTQLTPAELDRAIILTAKSESDFERRSTLVALIDTQSPRAPQQIAILRAVADIGSDFEQRTVMQSLAEKLDPSDDVSAAWGAALATIESDFEARTVLQTYAARSNLNAGAVRLALRNSAQLGSDFERRTALESLVPHVARHPGLAHDYAAAAAGIGSDFECRSALVALLEDTKPDVDASTAILAAVAEMGSDFEQRTVLVALAERMPADSGLIRRYREVARGLGDFERGQAEKALDRFES